MSKEPWWLPVSNEFLNFLWCTDFYFFDKNVVKLGFINHVCLLDIFAH